MRYWGFILLLVLISGCTFKPYANFFISIKCPDCENLEETIEVCQILNQKFVNNGIEPTQWQGRKSKMTTLGEEGSKIFYTCKLTFRVSDREDATALVELFTDDGVIYHNRTILLN